MERNYFTLNIKNGTNGLQVIGRNLILVFSVDCYLQLNTSHHFSLQCRGFTKPTSVLCLSQVEEHASHLLSRLLRWHQVQGTATHLSIKTEHHIQYYNICLSYKPRVLLPTSYEDLCWPPVGGSKCMQITSSFLLQPRGGVWTYFQVYGYLHQKNKHMVSAGTIVSGSRDGMRKDTVPFLHLPGWSL